MDKVVYWDSEFSNTSEESLFPVCFAYHSIIAGVETKDVIWTVSEEGKQEARDLFNSWEAEGCTLVAYAVNAEARFLLSLGIDPRRFKWIDLRLMYMQLLNHSKWAYGPHMVDGKVKNLRPTPPRWDREEGYKPTGKAESNLVSASYKMIGIERDADHKDETRELILSKKEFNDLEEIEILDYCMEDVIHLKPLYDALFDATKKLLKAKDQKNLTKELLGMADYAVSTALMEKSGYPLDYVATRSFADSVKAITFQMQKEVNEAFPDVGAFLIDKKGTKHTQKKKKIQAWVKSQNIDNWTETDKGDISLSLDAFEEHFSHRDDQTVFGNRFVKYLRDKQSLNGFSANTSKKTLWDSVGSDHRVRPYFNIYGSQSSRSQPSATGYILLKSSWMRVLIQPPKGKCMITIDYSSEEFLLAGLLSGDQKIVDAYFSGDPYMYTAILAGAAPEGATKETHGLMRDRFKSVVLAIQYGMTKYGLATKLTKDTGVEHDDDDAEELIELFEESYPRYVEWKEEIWDNYLADGYLRLPCGWTMFGENKNKRSVLNFPVQGTGASIMRKAVKLAQNAGLNVVMTLHDALYIEEDSSKVLKATEKLAWCMSEAFKHYFVGTPMEQYAVCRMDPAAWSPDFEKSTISTSIGDMPLYNKYIDQRRFEDYKRYRKYFVPQEEIDLLTSM